MKMGFDETTVKKLLKKVGKEAVDADDVARQAITDKYPSGECFACAREINEKFGDRIVLITGKFGDELKGPGGIDIGAPVGWHVFTIDPKLNAWDNFGKHGSSQTYLNSILRANPGATYEVFGDWQSATLKLFDFYNDAGAVF